jgi:hypothetical protein
VSQARATSLAFDDALRLARESIAKVEPGAPLVVAVVRLRSDSHALERPEKYNFYFKSSGVTAYVRVGFPDGDQNAMETKRDEEDGLILGDTPLGEWKATWQDALATAERVGGGAFRVNARTWLVRVVLTQEPELGIPLYRALYTSGSTVGQPNLDAAIDANTGAPPAQAQLFGLARIQARTALNGPVMVTGASATWRAQAPPLTTGFGADQPVSMSFSFARSDQDDRRSVNVSVGAQTVVNIGQTSARPPALPEAFDIVAAFQAVERGGGREVREGWVRAGHAAWTARAFVVNDAAPLVRVEYAQLAPIQFAPPAAFAQFNYDLASGRITRL